MNTTTAKRIANDSPFCEARAEMERIIDRLMSREALSMTLSEIERLVGAEGHELLRELMQAHVDLRAAQEPVVEVVGADGVPRTQVRRSTRTVETPHGEVTVTRNLYQAAGTEGLAPLDAALGLPAEHYSLEVRRLVAEHSARASFDEVVELVARTPARTCRSGRSRS